MMAHREGKRFSLGNDGEFAHLCGNSNVVAFAEKVIRQSYCDRMPHHASELHAMVGSIFQKLVGCCHSETEFAAALTYIQTHILRTDEPGFWFTQEYRRYKRDVKPLMRFVHVEPWLIGRRVLDFGCGDGALAELLHRQGYQVALTDVLDYRDTEARTLPFIRMERPDIVPFADRSFDTVLALSTLHHIDLADLSSVLSGLRRVARRVVVEEECYALPSNLDGMSAALAHDALLREFVAMAPPDQLDYLMFLDYFGNVLVDGLQQINLPFQFRTVDDWLAVFAEHDFVVAQVLFLGFQPAYFHRTSRISFALDTC
jgi:SAM-dependent methyltransferase